MEFDGTEYNKEHFEKKENPSFAETVAYLLEVEKNSTNLRYYFKIKKRQVL